MHHKTMRHAFLALGLVIVASVASAQEPPEVKVKLADGADGTMILALDKSVVAAGPVKFVIENLSSVTEHELLIVPWTAAIDALPYDTKAQQADEDQLAGMVGIEDIKPKATVIARFELKKGKYAVICNEPGHYKANMKSSLTVE